MKYLICLFILFIYIQGYAAMDIEKRGEWLNLVPFGLGQYQNGQNTKAFLYFTGETLLAGTALTTAAITYSQKKGKINKIEILSFVGFFALYGLGVQDAFSNYKKQDDLIIEKLKNKVEVKPTITTDSVALVFDMKF